ncbi:putative proteasome endopeptidase complex [Helianthus annuus]|nr:putative proteasome endopeptidase complex [Helianthus annuus]KAJ0761734.1 putative proteasome endopeptidase complex [Helianthus annuus]
MMHILVVHSEIQRTMMELLNQLDGFGSRGDVKMIPTTNKIESLDPDSNVALSWS